MSFLFYECVLALIRRCSLTNILWKIVFFKSLQFFLKIFSTYMSPLFLLSIYFQPKIYSNIFWVLSRRCPLKCSKYNKTDFIKMYFCFIVWDGVQILQQRVSIDFIMRISLIFPKLNKCWENWKQTVLHIFLINILNFALITLYTRV